MALKLLSFIIIALGITLPNFIFAESWRDDYDKRDYNRSTTSVNRSSDVRANRTMDTRPTTDEYLPAIDSSMSPESSARSMIHSDMPE